MKENRKLLKEVLEDIRHDMTDEEVLSLLAGRQISVKPENAREKYTLGQRAADTIAKFAGSWAFIFSFTGVLVLWMIVNAVLALKAFDPYPFILLNLVLSCVAAIQAPLIMMSQNRQEEKDRINDCRISAVRIFHRKRILCHKIRVVFHRLLIASKRICCLPECLYDRDPTDILRCRVSDIFPCCLYLLHESFALSL